MTNKECSTPVFTKKENVMLAQHIENLDWYHKNGENQLKMVKHFDAIYPNLKMNQPLVSAWVKGEANGGKNGHIAAEDAQLNGPVKHNIQKSQK